MQGWTLSFGGPVLCQDEEALKIRKSKYTFVILTEGNLKNKHETYVNESITQTLACRYDFVKLHSKTSNAFLRLLI
jgi:hypothetical protein